MTPADKQISDCEGKLALLLSEVKGTPIELRVQLWVSRMCSARKLSDYLADSAIAPKDKLTVARALIDILLTKELSRLPELPAVSEAPAQVDEPALPPQDELRAIIRQEVRAEFAAMLEMIAAALRNSK